MIGIIVNLWKMVRAVNEKGFCSVLLVLLGDGPTSCAVPPAPILKKYVMSRSLFYLILLLLMFSMNRSHAIKNGGQNGTHNRRRAPILYE